MRMWILGEHTSNYSCLREFIQFISMTLIFYLHSLYVIYQLPLSQIHHLFIIFLASPCEPRVVWDCAQTLISSSFWHYPITAVLLIPCTTHLVSMFSLDQIRIAQSCPKPSNAKDLEGNPHLIFLIWILQRSQPNILNTTNLIGRYQS